MIKKKNEVPLLELEHKDQLSDPVTVLRSFFSVDRTQQDIRNPHAETPVSDATKKNARLSAVLIPVVLRGNEPTVLITKRQSHIRFGGHLCFPGGIVDSTDASPVDAALRESKEEIDLDADQVEVLGTLGDYYTQAGYLMKPVVGLIEPPALIKANSDEVSAIYEIKLSEVLNSESYRLAWHTETRGHYAFENSAHTCVTEKIEANPSNITFDTDVRVAGPTVSILIGLYELLLEFHQSGVPR